MLERLRISELRPAKLVKAWRYFAPNLAPGRRWMAGALACGLGAVGMQLLRPWPLKLIFDGLLVPAGKAAPGGRLATAVPTHLIVPIACLSLLVISIVWGLLSYGQSYLTARAGQTIVHLLRDRVHTHLQRLSLNYHRRQRKGDLLMRLTGDINILRDMLVNASLQGVTATLMLAAAAEAEPTGS